MGEIALHIMGCDLFNAIIECGDLKLSSADEFVKSA